MRLPYEELQTIVNNYLNKVSVDAKGLAEARERCSDFLVVTAILTNHLKELEAEMARVSTEHDATFAQVIKELPGTKITEKKSEANLDSRCKDVRIRLGEIEAERHWVKSYQKIFENAHIVYRYYVKE